MSPGSRGQFALVGTKSACVKVRPLGQPRPRSPVAVVGFRCTDGSIRGECCVFLLAVAARVLHVRVQGGAGRSGVRGRDRVA